MAQVDFDYTICSDYNIEKYRETVEIIAKKFPEFHAKKEIVDSLDGDMIQIFEHENDKIQVVNDYMTGAVYVKSTVAIQPFSN